MSIPSVFPKVKRQRLEVYEITPVCRHRKRLSFQEDRRETVKGNYGIDKGITNLRFVGRFFTLSH
jgi:hypothetical protein